jgi:NADH-ubiquinone oxidoreductase chain 5
MYLSILILPLLGSFFSTNRKAGKRGGTILSVICM